jgi:hypothetical protein
MLYSITCSGPGGTKELTLEGGGTVSTSLAAGAWHIIVDAVYQNIPAGRGEGDVEIRAGAANTVDIKMIPADDFASPVITQNPQDITILRYISPAGMSLAVEAMSFFQGDLSYQWYRNPASGNSGGTPIPGEEKPVYTPPVGTLGTVYYYAEITGADNRKRVSEAAAVNVINPDRLRVDNAKTAEGGAYGMGEPFKYRVTAFSEGSPYNITGQVNNDDFNYNFSTVGTKTVSVAAASSLYGIPLDFPVTVAVKSLEDRLAWANGQSGTHTLLLYTDETMPPVSALSQNITGAEITLKSGDGSTGGMRILQLYGNGFMFYIEGSGAKLILDRNVTLRGTTNDATVVSVTSSGELIMNTGSAITGHINQFITGWGGGVRVESGGIFTMNGGSISGNRVVDGNRGGGGVYINSGTFVMNGGTIGGDTTAEKNTAAMGGGVYVDCGTFNMSGGTISGNEAYGTLGHRGGGGVFINGGIATMTGGTIRNNEIGSGSVLRNGGGVYVDSGTFNMSGSASISNNTGSASTKGGGVYVNNGNFTMGDSASISGNAPNSDGGGVGVENGGIFIMNDFASIRNNRAGPKGGGVYVFGASFVMNGSTSISGNEASSGGGVYVAFYSGSFTMGGGTIGGNRADGTGGDDGGGGVYVGNYATFTLNQGTVYGMDEPALTNTTSGTGAALYKSSAGTAVDGISNPLTSGSGEDNTITR